MLSIFCLTIVPQYLTFFFIFLYNMQIFIFQAIKVALDQFQLIDDFPFINNILFEILLNKQFVLIPNSVIISPPNVALYDIETKMNINDVVKEAFYNKVTPTFYSIVSYFCLNML